MNNYKENDDDVVVMQKQQLLQHKTSVEVSYPIYQRINNYISKKYPHSENTENWGELKAKEIDYIFSLGVERAEQELECSILFEEKKPRRDVLVNLGKIACVFKVNPEYPKIKSMTITKTINTILGLKDKRTREKYLKCVKQYLGRVQEFGIVDVSDFVNRIPRQYLDTTTSTSSFGEKYD